MPTTYAAHSDTQQPHRLVIAVIVVLAELLHSTAWMQEVGQGMGQLVAEYLAIS